MGRVLVFILLVVSVSSCLHEYHTQDKLTSEERNKFPQDYFHQDKLHLAFPDSLPGDTFILEGDEVISSTVSENHSISSEELHIVDMELIEKEFKSPNSKLNLLVSAPFDRRRGTDPDFGHYLGIVFADQHYMVQFSRITNSDSDQVIPYFQTYRAKDGTVVDYHDTIIYNRITGVRKITHLNIPEEPGFKVEFF